MPNDVTATRLRIAIEALEWIAQHETDEEVIDQRGVCANPFHVTRQDGDDRCPDCSSRWWATDGSLPGPEGSYALGAVAAKALADIAALRRQQQTPGDGKEQR